MTRNDLWFEIFLHGLNGLNVFLFFIHLFSAECSKLMVQKNKMSVREHKYVNIIHKMTFRWAAETREIYFRSGRKCIRWTSIWFREIQESLSTSFQGLGHRHKHDIRIIKTQNMTTGMFSNQPGSVLRNNKQGTWETISYQKCTV